MKKRNFSVCFVVCLYLFSPEVSLSQSAKTVVINSSQEYASVQSEVTETLSPKKDQIIKKWLGEIKPSAGHNFNEDMRTVQRVPYWKQRVRRPLK